MSILLFDGFESDLSQASFLRRYPNSTNVPANFPVTPGRLGGNALRHNAGVNVIVEATLPEQKSDDFIIAFGIRMGAVPVSTYNLITVENASGNDTFQVTIKPLSPGFGIAIKRYDSAGTTSTLEYNQTEYPLEIGEWHYIEVKAPLRQGSGGVIVKANGDTLVSNYAPRADVGAGYAIVYFNMVNPSSTYVEIDDLYVASGSDFKFLGPGAQVSSLYPKLDNDRGWSVENAPPLAHFQAVDDAADQGVDDDTTYVYATSPGLRDTYYYKEPLGIRNGIQALQVHTDIRSDAGVVLQVEPILRSVIMPRISAPVTYARRIIQYATDPITNKPWSIEGLDNIIAGVKIPGDEVPPGTALYFTLKSGLEVYVTLDAEDDLPITIGTVTVQVLDVGGIYIPITLKTGAIKELHFDSTIVTASWEPWNQEKVLTGAQKLYNAHFRSDGGFLESPDGVSQSYTVSNPQQIRIAFSSAAKQAGTITLITLPGNTATGSHFSIPGGNTRPVLEGDDFIDVPVQVNASTWHKAKTAAFYLQASVGIELTGHREWHLWVYPQALPPNLRFDSAGTTAGAPGGVNVPITQSAISQETTTVHFRFDGTIGTWVEGEHFTMAPVTLSPGATSIIATLQLLDQAFTDFPGGRLTLYLDHEPSDGSQESFWQFTEDWIMEGQLTEADIQKEKLDDGELIYPYAGEVGTHAPGGGSNQDDEGADYRKYFGWFIKKQSSFGITSPILKPNGEEMQMLVSPSWLKTDVSDWYIRESFFLEDASGGRGRKQVFKNFILCGSYVHPFNETEAAPYKNSRFFVFGPRNRAPGDMEMQATFQRRDTQAQSNLGSRNVFIPFWHDGVLQTQGLFFAGSYWSPWAMDNMNPASELGIEIETDPVTLQQYLRFWVLIVVDGIDWVRTNTAKTAGNQTGTCTLAGTNTVLKDGNAQFTSKRLNVGDVVVNNKDGSESYIASVPTSDTELTVAGLHGGLDNLFEVGDDYFIARNYTTLVDSVDTKSPGPMVKVTITPFGGSDLSSEQVGKQDEFYNNGAGGGVAGLYGIDFDTDHETVYGEPAIGTDYFYTNKATAAEIIPDNVITIRHRSVQVLPNADWSGNGIFRYNAVSPLDSYNGQQSSPQILGSAKEKGICAWGPQYVVAGTRDELLRNNKPDPFYGPDDPSVGIERARYWEKRGAWWEPRGNATRLSGGQTTFTIILT